MNTELKKVLTFSEGCEYAGISHSCMYKMTSQKVIPHYKPAGKLIFFEREELEKWLLSVKVKSQSEIEDAANTYIVTGKHKQK
ncbi:MAG: helix-turn-helix domain-containing protein [Paludibacter sp.]